MREAHADKQLRGGEGGSSRVPEKKTEKTEKKLKKEQEEHIERLVEDARAKAAFTSESIIDEEEREAQHLNRRIRKCEAAPPRPPFSALLSFS